MAALHMGEKPYKCNVCGKNLKNVAELESHSDLSHEWEVIGMQYMWKFIEEHPRNKSLHDQSHGSEAI